ncbi:MAG: hypothetical protein ACK4WB_03605 [Desulfatiglandales bacterium]
MEFLNVTKERKINQRTCLACGDLLPKRKRKYCSSSCRDQIMWVLGLSKGLLKTFNIRFATFSFTDTDVILDMLPCWSEFVSRFSLNRTPGHKPAHDLKRLVLACGEKWYSLLKERHSKSSASLRLITQNHRKDIDPNILIPKLQTRPKLTREEREYLKLLRLREEELFSDLISQKIRSSYRRMAKLLHPDVGGSEELFKLLNEAHTHMLRWSTRPRYTVKRSISEFWSYDNLTNRWTPPAF